MEPPTKKPKLDEKMQPKASTSSKSIKWKINSFKILKLTNEFLDTFNDNAQILYIDNAKKRKYALEKFDFEYFPNIFAVVVKSDVNEWFWTILKQILTDNREIIVQIYSPKKSSRFFKFSNSQGKSEIVFEPNRLENTKKISCLEDFLRAINTLQVSLVNVDFNQVLESFNITNAKDKYCVQKEALKTKDDIFVKLSLLFVPELSTELLREALKSDESKILYSFLSNFKSSQINEENLTLILKSKHIKDIFHQTARTNDVKVLKIILKNRQKFAGIIKFPDWCEAAKISPHNKYQDPFLLYLHRIESEYFSNKTKQDVLKLHEFIEKKNFDKVKTFRTKNPHLKLCCDSKKISALEKALYCKKFKIYAFLRSEHFLVYDEERFDRKMNELTKQEKDIIFEQNLSFTKNNPYNYLNILENKIETYSSHHSKSRRDIRIMLEELNKREEIQTILQIASQIDMKITVDFSTIGVNTLCPRERGSVMGFTHISKKRGVILLGRNKNKCKLYGTVVHEFLHKIFDSIYENNFLPYHKSDKKKEAAFDAVYEVTKSRLRRNTDSIIAQVFEEGTSHVSKRRTNTKHVFTQTCFGRFAPHLFKQKQSYTKHILKQACFNRFAPCLFKVKRNHLKKSELAVRVGQLIARYLNNPQKIREIQNLFPELFNFFYESVLPDLKIKNVYRLIKLNNEFGVIKTIQESKLSVKPTDNLEIIKTSHKRIILRSNVPQLTLSKLLNEVKSLQGNKLNLKAKNIFVDLDKLEQEHIRNEIEDILSNSEVEKIFVSVKDFGDKNLEFLINLESRVKVFVIAYQNVEVESFIKEYKSITLDINHKWDELTDSTKEETKNKSVKFHGKQIKVSQVLENFDSISSEILSILCSDEEISISCGPEVENLENFIPRQIIEKGEEKRSYPNCEKLEDFIKSIDQERFVVISDVAGSGKTTALKKVQEILVESFPTNWISFITLRDFSIEFSDDVGESFQEFIIRILKLNILEAKVFNQKFEKGEAIFLFDAFDEISSTCQKNALKLFKLLENKTENQIWVTTRNYFQEDLEKELNTKARKFANLTKMEQVQLLRKMWKNSHSDERFIYRCAVKLVEKIQYMLESWNDKSVIGVPLIAVELGKYFVKKIDKTFDDEFVNFDISLVFKNIVINASLKVFRSKYPEKAGEYMDEQKDIINVHQYFAFIRLLKNFNLNVNLSVVNRLSQRVNNPKLIVDFASEFNLNYDDNKWSLDEIEKGGLMSFDKNKKVTFNHQTIVEYLFAKVIFEFLKHSSKLSDNQLNLLISIVKNDYRFGIVRMFLEYFLIDFKEEEMKIFKSREKVCRRLHGKIVKFDFLKRLIDERLLNFFRLVLCFAKHDQDSFKNILEAKNKRKETVSMRIFPEMSLSRNSSKLLEEIYNVYGINCLQSFWLKTDDDNNLFISYLIIYSNVLDNENFWGNIDGETIEKILLHNDGSLITECLLAYDQKLIKLERIEYILNIPKTCLDKEKQKELLVVKNHNIFHTLILYSVRIDIKFFDLIYNFVSTLITKEEIFRDRNILFDASFYATSNEVVEKLFVIFDTFTEDEQKNILNEYEVKLLLRAAISKKEFSIFKTFFRFLSNSLCNHKGKLELIKESKILYEDTGSNTKISLLKYIFSILDENDLKDFLAYFKEKVNYFLHKAFSPHKEFSHNLDFNLINFMEQLLKLEFAIDGHSKTLLDFFLESENFWAKNLFDSLSENGFIEQLEICFKNFREINPENLFDDYRYFMDDCFEWREYFVPLFKFRNKNGKDIREIAADEKWESEMVEFVEIIENNILNRDFFW